MVYDSRRSHPKMVCVCWNLPGVYTRRSTASGSGRLQSVARKPRLSHTVRIRQALDHAP